MIDDQQPLRLPKPTSEQLRVVHLTCERFEKAWRHDASVTIEQYLSGSTVELRPYLLEALVRSEIELRESSGGSIEPREFLQRFASESGIIARAFMPPDKLDELDSGDECQTVAGDDLSSLNGSKPSRLGHFEIRDEIARGGMGVVYRGWHAELRREVAVKCIRSGEFADERAIERFRREAQTVASLKHDGIVPIYEVGNEQGLYYFVMPLIEGDSLGKRLTRGPIDHRELARIARDSAIATQFAHDHGVVHRDLKPSNILVDQQGKVWVADFGLSTNVQANEATDDSSTPIDQGLSVTGQIFGTPAYMAPEQVQGQSNELTDVYGLGAILYTGLTGRPPHRAATVAQTFQQILENEPVAPRALDPQIPRDLETITLKALSKTASQRYASAKELANDLTRYLEGRTILAKPAAAPERIWRWVMREPAVASLALGIMAALAIGLGVSLRFYGLALANERIASANSKMAMDSVDEYFTRIADSPELGDKGLEALRRQLLSSALTFYERLASQEPSSLPLRERLAQSHERLGMIHAALGDQERADDEFQKMRFAYRDLRQQFPDNIEYQRSVIEAVAQRAQVFSDRTKYKESQGLVDEAVKLAETLVERKEDGLHDRVMLASLYSLRAENSTSLSNSEETKKSLSNASKLCDELAKIQADSLSAQSSQRLVRTFDRMASQFQHRSDFDATEKWCKLGIEFCQRQTASQQRSPQIRFFEARLHKNLNLLYTRTQRLDLATPEFERCNELLAELLKEHPLVFDYMDQKATLLSNAGGLFSMKGQFEQARQLTEESIAIQQQIIARQPDVAGHWAGLSNAYATLGAINRNSFKLSEAETALKLGIQASEKAARMAPESTGGIYFGINLRNSLAELYLAQKRFQDSLDILQPLTTAVETLVAKNQDMHPYRALATSIYRSLAICNRKLNDVPAALVAADKAITLFESLPAQVVSTGVTPRLLTDSLFTKAHSCFVEAKYPEATGAIDRALDVLTPRIEDAKTPAANAILFRAPRADFYDLKGQIAAANQEHAKAVVEYHQAIADQLLVMEYYKDQPVPLKMARDLHAPVQLHLARSLMQLNKRAEALQACDKAIEMNTADVEQAKSLRAEVETPALK